MRAFRPTHTVLISTLSAFLVTNIMMGCSDDSSTDEAQEDADHFHQTRNLMDVVIAVTLFEVPDERERMIEQETDNGGEVAEADTDFEDFLDLFATGNRIIEIRHELERSGHYLPEIEPQYR